VDAGDLEQRVRTLDVAALAPLVRRAVGRPDIEPDQWRCERAALGSTQAAGIFRVSGTARGPSAVTVPWSLVVKILAPGRSLVAGGQSEAEEEETHPFYWRREPQVYRSGLLEQLAGLAVPRCYAVDEHGDDTWIWLEDVAEPPEARWPLSRYGLAARHLGVFNGVYLTGRPPPVQPWLTVGVLRQRVEARLPELARLDASRDQQPVRRGWPDDLIDRVLRIAEARHVLLDVLDGPPRVLCHNDAGRKNLFTRRRAGVDETVAIDWGWIGMGALGGDPATLVGSSVLWFDVDEAEILALDQACFEGYVAGLRDAGWRGDERLARRGFAAAAALRFAFIPVFEVLDAAFQAAVERAFGRPMDDVLKRLAAVRRYALDRADEATGLTGPARG
jgi:hypothetical protein